MSRVITGRIMHGGWNFLHGEDVIRANSFEELLEAVRDYRLANGIDVGNVYADVEAQICQRYPDQCKGYTPYADPNAKGVKEIRVIDRIARWAAKIGGLAHRRVRSDEAERRAAICTSCIENVNWLSGCSGCVKNAERLCALIRGSSESSKASNLKACKILGHCNRTAIWLDLTLINKSDTVPAHCWAKK